MCARCHSGARFGLQRRSEEEWKLLVHFHVAQHPTLEFHSLSRDRPWFQLAMNEKLHPFDHQFPMVALRGIGITLVAGGAALLAGRLPDAIALPLIILLAVAAIWLSLRFALPHADRASLGKTARKLRLIS